MANRGPYAVPRPGARNVARLPHPKNRTTYVRALPKRLQGRDVGGPLAAPAAELALDSTAAVGQQ
eukprot:scaffold94033_cov33-Phaeocystis_antarctica.AAC.1